VAKEPLPENTDIIPDGARGEAGAVTVREILAAPALKPDLEVLQGVHGLDNEIRSPRIQKLGMALAGYASYIDPGRLQIIGSSEANYLKALNDKERSAAILRLKKYKICCILVTKNLDVPEELLKLSSEEGIPILRSAALNSVSLAKLVGYLEKRLAPRQTIHGVLLEIFGLGVLILGPSGIGKSECALDLVLKGHRLISDDYVELTRRSIDRLSGSGGKVLKHHMELRGLGIINIKELFGISATGASQNVDFAVKLERWKSDSEYDRLGLDSSNIDFLGVSIPLIIMPVAPGRNIATLIEVAARVHLLRQRGYRPAFRSDDL
jgi:HPr kinase/phosphorylase